MVAGAGADGVTAAGAAGCAGCGGMAGGTAGLLAAGVAPTGGPDAGGAATGG